MRTTQPSLGKYVCGMLASLIIFLAGGWLILAPFALGYQPSGANWTNQTVNDFVVGICVAVVALVTFVLFFYGLLGSLRASGVIAARAHVQQQPEAPVQYSHPVAAPQASVSNQSDLDRTLATLAAALAADMAARRQGSNDQQANSLVEPTIERREV